MGQNKKRENYEKRKTFLDDNHSKFLNLRSDRIKISFN